MDNKPNFRNRYDSAPTLLLPKVKLPDTNSNRHPMLRFTIYATLCVLALLVTLCLLPFFLPISLVFRIYRNILISQIEKRHKKKAIVMPGTDALWLQDTPTNMAVISCVLFIKGTPDVTRFSNKVKERMVDIVDPENPSEKWFPKTTKYPMQILHCYTWLEEEHFKMSDHVFEYHRHLPDTKEELESMMGEIASTPLSTAKSPWQFVLIPPNPAKPDHYAAIFRVHHAIADGLAIARVVLKQLMDNEPQKRAPNPSFGSKYKWTRALNALFEGQLMVVQRFLLSADNNVLHGPQLTGQKLVSWSEPIDVVLIKKMKNVTGTTVNDVLISCLGGALRSYMKKHGAACPDELLSYVPVNLRKPSKQVVLDNQFVLVFLRLPTHTDDSTEQLAHTAERMNQIKVSAEPIVNSLLMRYCMTMLPNWMTRMTFDMFARKCTLIVSNVPGPQEEVSMSGELIEDIMFWPPTRANVGLGVSILSYAGRVRVGIMCDKALLSNPKVLVDNFVDQVKNLASELRVDKVD